ncbi:amino acid adenylation domain-containing protein [Streptomyces sp. NPDC014006]|uniref:non-ribosomal peptide synthetase n=1 Tax=Streptomyces sp. NPDC014006 TaxID=3364870 RepID=UPI0036F7CF24
MDEPAGCSPSDSLSPIQRAYLVGDQDGLELRGPARYYLACDLNTGRVPGIGDRLRRLVRTHDVLRVEVAADLSLTTLPEDAARNVVVDVRHVDDGDFEAANDAVRRSFTAGSFVFDSWPQLRVVVVRSPHQARLHLVYALWLMDAASLNLFLTDLVAGRGEGAGHDETAVPGGVRQPARGRDRSARARRFWRERAAALPDPAELPLRPDWRQACPDVTHRMVTVDAAAAERIAKTARDHGLTPAMVYLAAYGVTLGRIGGGTAHTLTVLYSRRAQPSAYDSLGNHGNTMPLEVPGTAGQSFAEVARSVQSRYLAQAMHASLSGAEIARLGDPGGDPRRLPHPFAFTALDVDSLAEADLGFRRRWEEVQLRVPQVLIDHQVVLDADGTVRLGFDWRTDAFDPGFGEDFVDQHAEFVRELADSAENWTWTATRPALGPSAPAERRVSAGDTLQDRVLRCVADTPDAPAVHDAHGTLSYRELADHAYAVAGLLVEAGARSGDRVAVHLPRGRGQVVAVLGSLLAGCVYIPLDHGTPDGRLDSIARRGEVRFALTDGRQGCENRWTRRGVRALALPAAPFAPCPPARRASAGPSPTAYIIFTSGSTGEPKGVVISHAAVLNTLDAVNDELGLRSTDCVLSVSSIGFDLSVYDIFGPLLRGGSVVMLSEETARNPAAWARLVDHHGVTIWNSAPALAALLAEEGTAVPSVRTFLLSGDWIPLTLPGALKRLAPSSDVLSLGGATECSIWSIRHPVREADCAGRSIPYGTALPGQEILVLDAERELCPDWHIGEIHIAGAGLADGYANDPVKTEAAFVDDPAFGRLYRTGDRGRRHPNGDVEFLGRTDTQVKLNGHRVELGEIENLLEGLDGIRRCAASVHGQGRRKRVVAHVTLAADASGTWRQDAYAVLRDALPQYMVPDALVELDELPLTSNGKVDRRRLQTLPVGDPAESEDQAPQRLGLHAHEVALCWQEVLGEAPGERTFFESGGGSYDAIRLLSLLRSRLGHDVSFGEFMADPTVSGLASLCGLARTAQDGGIWTFRPRSAAAPRLRLILFPPVGGGVSCYSGLVRGLEGDVDVHVIGFDGPVTEGSGGGLSGLARRCLDRLPGEVLSGDVPRVFAGWSFGGALAFEAAGICGMPVARVVVVDTPVSTDSRGGGQAAEPSLDGFVRDVEETSGVVLDAQHMAADPTFARRFEVYRQNLTLLRDWTPRRSSIPLVEFRAEDRPAEQDPGAWSRVAQVQSAHTLTGGHFDVFEGNNVRQVGKAIEEVKDDDQH